MADQLPARQTTPGSAYNALPRRLRRFVDQYVVGATPGAALRHAGYTGLHPTQIGHKWLKRPAVAAAIQEATDRHVAEIGVRQVTVLRQMHSIATADPRKLEDANGQRIPLHLLDDATAAAIASVEIEEVSTQGREGTRYKYKFWDKVKANDRLGQFVKLWEQRATNVTVDARSVTINSGGATEAALQQLADLTREIAALGAGQAAQASDQDRLVLSAPLRDGAAGHRAPLDVSADSGDPEQS